eukprot:TRINITY_DN12568_c3_g1_i1.p1 TRINITY_DN12568_c3_g1~~TRINITY_DN12568_c3_g1_i1.p1  ORF type:complete len:944 (-),score=152.40 TRINITY_DN12568_c3_g1_i1:66-2897(-)
MQRSPREPCLPTNGGDTLPSDMEPMAQETSAIAENEVVLHDVAAADAQSPGLVTESNLQPLLESSGLRDLITEVAHQLLTQQDVVDEIIEEVAERKSHIAEARDDIIIHVEFEANTWSSFYLFFVRLENGKSVFTKFEQVTILVTIAGTWFIQGLLILVIWSHMIDDPFDKETIMHMLRYRVLHGHSFSQVQTETGKSYMQVFCDEETAPWGWEAEQYAMLVKYLDGFPPGFALTVVALIGWVMCCAFEFRTTVEQALATVNLNRPNQTPHRRSIHLDEDEIQVLSLSMTRKILVICLISMPRMLIMVTLLYTGCKYLCNTISLEDLVLNAMALVFVIEFDELIFAVCVTARAQRVVACFKPLTFPVYKLPGGLILKDLVRMSLALLVVFLSITQLLTPFIDSARAAKDALCGGDTALSYQAYTPLSFIHVLKHDQDFAQCPSSGHEYGYYLKEMYNVAMPSENTTNLPDPSAVQDDRISLLLDYIYRDEKQAQPTRLTETLTDLQAKAGMGSSAQPQSCLRFDPSKGIEACRHGAGSDSEKACAWPYRSYLCEDWPAFSANRIKKTACAAKPTTNLSCALWEKSGHKNPFTFCQAEKISGSFSVNYGRMTKSEKTRLQNGFSVIDNEYVYFQILGQFLGWTAVEGAVQRQGRSLQAKRVRAGGGVQVQLQRGSVLERRLGHESEVRFLVLYEVLIPFPNTAFVHSARQIYDDLSSLASDTSSSRALLVEKFEQFFSQLTSNTISKGCLLTIENVSVPTWTPLDTDLVAESPSEDDNAKCSEANQCVDAPGWHWVQDDRYNCESFEASGWCVNGSQGPTFDTAIAKLSDYVDAAGISAVAACCACGGGTKAAGSAARQLMTSREENKSTSSILQSPVGTSSAVFGKAAEEASATAGGQMMHPGQHVSETSVDLKTLLTRLAALESEVVGLRAELASMKAAPQV